MKILVCVKQVPDTTEVKIDKEKGTIIREGVKSILNPDDRTAVEEALKIKDNQEDVEITALTMGPPQAEEILREVMSMGVDKGVLVSDRAFGGADTWATSNTISSAIKALGDFDLILTGRQAIDGDTAQVGPQISEKLGIPQVTYVQGLKVEKDKLRIKKETENGVEILEVKMPALLTVIKELNTPRYMFVDKIFESYKKEIKILTLEDIEVTKDQVGLKASPTKVYKSFTQTPRGNVIMLDGNIREKSMELIEKLKENHII